MREYVILEPDIPKRRFEDFKSGQRLRLGAFTLTPESSIAFARLYDPEPFHIDPVAAAANPVFGRLSASGWQTATIMKMLVAEYLGAAGLNSLAGGGVKNLEWRKPVFPPVTLSFDMEVLEARPSNSRPDRGVMSMRITALDEAGDCVSAMDTTGIFAL